MAKLHLYISSSKFNSEDELNEYLQPSYTEDGDIIKSPFMEEAMLENYEPMCIEAIFEEENKPIQELLEETSYYDQWGKNISDSLAGNVAVCIYEPNLLGNPEGAGLNYLGEYTYNV